jgi:hypothetical protein
MLVGNNALAMTKKAGESLAISIAMRMRWYDAPDGAHPGLHPNPLDAAIGRVLSSHRRGGRYGQRFRSKTQNTNKKLFLAS